MPSGSSALAPRGHKDEASNRAAISLFISPSWNVRHATSCRSSRSSGAERHLSARRYGLKRLLVCTLTSCLKPSCGGPQAHTKRSAGYKRHITAGMAAGSFAYDLRVGQGRNRGGVEPVSFFVRLTAAGLLQQTLLPFLLQLVQAGEHGWVH